MFRKGLLALTVFGYLSLATPKAQAENWTSLPDNFGSIWEIIEKLLITGGLALPGTLKLGACTPSLSISLPMLTFTFAKNFVCPIAGTASFGLFPMRSVVKLDVFNTPMIEAIEFDTSFSIRRKNRITTTTLNIADGRLAIRPLKNGPLKEVMMNGAGLRTKSKAGIQGNMRINIFDSTTKKGFALVKTVLKEGDDPKSKKVETCQLSDADISNVLGGTLEACRPIINK
jgi:hypothetical protein